MKYYVIYCMIAGSIFKQFLNNFALFVGLYQLFLDMFWHSLYNKCVIHVIILLCYIHLQCIINRINEFNNNVQTAIFLFCRYDIDVNFLSCFYFVCVWEWTGMKWELYVVEVSCLHVFSDC